MILSRLCRPGAMIAMMLAALWLALAVPAAAQEQPAPDYTQWQSLVARAEKLIGDHSITDTQLSDMREKLAEWRDTFAKTSQTNKTQIDVVRDQLAALGTPPKEGETEPEQIAQRRSELNEQLAQLQAPGLKAVEARTLAEANIDQIDRALRERQADELLTIGPSPINPAYWPDAVTGVSQGTAALISETTTRLRDGRVTAAMRENGPVVVLLLALAVLLVARGRSWIERASNYFLRAGSIRGKRVLAFLVSLGQIIVPVIGLILLSSALEATQLTGSYGAGLLEALVPAGLSFFAAHWLGRCLFPRAMGESSVVPLAARQRRNARFFTSALGLILGLYEVLHYAVLPTIGLTPNNVATPASLETAAVLSFPLIAIAGLCLFRLSMLLRLGASNTEDHALHPSMQAVRLVALLFMMVAIIAPVLAMIGYMNAASALIWPSALSLALAGTIILLQGFFADIYAAFMRDAEGARDALIPVLVGFALVLLSVPLFALIWGMPAAEIGELWMRFRAGMSLGGVKVSPSAILTFALVFSIGYMLTRLLQGTLRNTVLPKTRIDKGGQNAIVAGLGYVGIFLAALSAITSAGIDLSSLAIVAGALSVGIGFGLQNIVSNFVSGIILLIERPITEGDWIEVGGQQGYVRSISVRSTRIETFDRTDVIVPNADFVSGQVVNYTRGNSIGRLIVPVGVAYGNDTRLIHNILMEIAENHPMVMINPGPAVVFIGFGASSLDFEIRVILSDVNQKLSVMSEMNHQIAERFAKDGIEIPFPQQDLWLRNPESLRAVAMPHQTPAPDTGATNDISLIRDDNPDDGGDGDGDS